MRKSLATLMVLIASSASAQKLDELERKQQLDKALSAIEDLSSLSGKMANTTKTQCLTAVANPRFCDCPSSNLPIVIDFVQYVALVNQTKEELQYDKQSKQDKEIIDNTRKARDACSVVR